MLAELKPGTLFGAEAFLDCSGSVPGFTGALDGVCANKAVVASSSKAKRVGVAITLSVYRRAAGEPPVGVRMGVRQDAARVAMRWTRTKRVHDSAACTVEPRCYSVVSLLGRSRE